MLAGESPKRKHVTLETHPGWDVAPYTKLMGIIIGVL